MILIPIFLASSRRSFFHPDCVSQPQRSSGYAFGFLPCRLKKSLAALDAKKLSISIRESGIFPCSFLSRSGKMRGMHCFAMPRPSSGHIPLLFRWVNPSEASASWAFLSIKRQGPFDGKEPSCNVRLPCQKARGRVWKARYAPRDTISVRGLCPLKLPGSGESITQEGWGDPSLLNVLRLIPS